MNAILQKSYMISDAIKTILKILKNFDKFVLVIKISLEVVFQFRWIDIM